MASPILSPGAVPEPAPVAPQEEAWQENLNTQVMCRECKEIPPNIVEEFSNGDMVCGSCGLVLGDRIVDTRSEWRTFSNDDQGNDDPSRVGDGANPLLNGSQLQTSISFGDGGSGRSRDLHRTQNKSTHDKSTQGLLAAYKQIGAYCDVYQISKVACDTAKQYYKQVDDAKAFKGKTQDAIIAGCLFIACRQNNVPRTFREIYALTKVSKKEIGRSFKALEKFFATSNTMGPVNTGDLRIAYPSDGYAATTSTKAQELCSRYSSQLGLGHQIAMISGALADKVAELGALAGRSPLSVAAACIFMASYLMKNPRTAKEISNIAGVSDGTIRTAYKVLYGARDKLVDPDSIKDGKGDMKLLPVVQ
ncbi:MAG: hypothetical protein M1812_006538 [Candelaria pacifica]|nr:MAG: hypothetical protein M1812_006538 [Candelaria pacifica]